MNTDNSAANINIKMHQVTKDNLIAQIDRNLKAALNCLVELEELCNIKHEEK